MKNYYSLFISLFLLLSTHSSIAQTWTIYNDSNSIIYSAGTKNIAIDQSGNVWAGGIYSALYKFNGTTWSEYTSSNSNLLDDDINALLVDNSNKLWVANWKGISVFNGTTFTNYDTINAGFNGMTVYSLGKDNSGKIWLASRNGSFGYEGITTFDGTNWTNLTGYPSQIDGEEFSDFAFNAANDAWLACNNGVAKYNNGTFTFYPPVTSMWASQRVAIDADGNMWAGGFDGLVKYNGTSWTKYSNATDFGLNANTLYYDIFPEGDILWIATSAGLLKFSRTSGTIVKHYKPADYPIGIPLEIAKDANGYLWFASTAGVIKMDQTSAGTEEIKNKRLSVYPNPSEGIFNFSFEEQTNITYKIFSVNGTLIQDGKSEAGSNFQVNLSDSPCGVYYIHVSTDAVNQAYKLIKY